MATNNLFSEDDIKNFMDMPKEEDELFSPEDIQSVNASERTNPANDIEQKAFKNDVNRVEADQDERDFIADASKGVKPKYDNAIGKVNRFFESDAITNITGSSKLSSKDKAAFLGLDFNTKGLSDKDIDKLVMQKRVKDLAISHPDFVSKADVKTLEQIYTNPEAIKKLTNSAKARAAGQTTLEKFAATNTASVMQMVNTVKLISGGKDFDQWALEYALLDSAQKASSVRTEGSDKFDAMWADPNKSFVSIIGDIFTDIDLAKAAVAEASNSAASVGTSIAGGLVGGLAGAPLGPAGVAKGAFVGRALGAAIPSFNEYIQNEIDTNYRDKNGNINLAAMKRDSEKLMTKWKVEASEHALIMGSIEAVVGKGFKGAGKGLSSIFSSAPKKEAAKTFSAATVKALAKTGKFATKAAGKGVEEFSTEALGSFTPKTVLDFQNGRLNKTVVGENAREAGREGVAGLVTGGALGPVSIAVEAGTNAAANKVQAKRETKLNSKPFNEFTKQDIIDAEYTVNESEEVIERLDGIDEDSETISTLTELNDQEKIQLLDNANTEDTVTEDGAIIEGKATEAIVNGADLETLLGEDVNAVVEVLSKDRQSELTAAISTGENFTFTYGEWVVALSKIKEKHPTAYHLTNDSETNMPGYEAVENLSEVLDVLQEQYDSLIVPAQGDLPPTTPGISTEVFNETSAEIKPKKQTSIVNKVTPTKNLNEVILELADGSKHTINLYNKESPVEVQELADRLTKQFTKALKASGKTDPITIQASLEGIPIIMRVLIKRANALGKPLTDFSKSISFKSDKSHRSAYISMNPADPSIAYYGVGRSPQRVSTVIHEFAHAILNFMFTDVKELNAQEQAGTLNEEGVKYLETIKATAKLLGEDNVLNILDGIRTSMELTDPKTGKVLAKSQSKGMLTKFTVLQEKLATTMEVFLKTGELETDSMEAEVSKILLYWRSLIPIQDITRLKASDAAKKGWTLPGEYHQALDPSDEVSRVFNSFYSVNQTMDTQSVPLFNISFFPVEMLGKKGQLIIDKVIASKHTAIAKVFAKMYADSINARNEINTPESIETMNRNLYNFYSQTNAGMIVQSLNDLGMRVPENLGPEVKAIQDFVSKYGEAPVEYTKTAEPSDLEAVIQGFSGIVEEGDSTFDTFIKIVETFNNNKEEVYDRTLEELGYVNDADVKAATESMLAKALPAILSEQFTQIVAAYPLESKALFSSYMKSGKVSSRVAHKQISQAALDKFNALKARDVKVKPFIKKVTDASNEVVNLFNQGRYLEALAAKHNELIASEMLNLAPEMVNKVKSSIKALDTFTSLDYQYARAGKVHPEVLGYLRKAIEGIAQGTPVDTTTIIPKLDWQLNNFVAQLSQDLNDSIAGVPLDSVEAVNLMGDYAKLMNQVALGAMKLENEGRLAVQNKKINEAKITVLKSTKAWDMRSKWLPQVNSVHEIFSTYYPSEAEYRESALYDMIYDIENGEADTAIETEKISKRLRAYAAKSVAKPLPPTSLERTGLQLKDKDERLSVLLYMGSKSGIEALVRTHNLVKIDPLTNTEIDMTEELKQDMDDMINSGDITQADVDFVNAIWAEFVPLLDKIQEVYRRDRGIEVGEVKATPFVLGGMEFDGGYFPISTNRIEVIGDKNPALDFYSTFGIKTFSRTKQRGDKSRNPVRLGLTAVPSYIGIALREYHIAPKLNLFNAFINDPEVNAHVELTRPGALGVNKGIINDWVDSVRDQIADKDAAKSSKMVGMIQRNTSLVFFSTDIVSASMNLAAGIPASIPYVGSKVRLMSNIALLPFKITTGKWRRTSALSKQMMSNEKAFIQFVANEYSEDLYSKKTTATDFLRKAALFTQRASQQVLEQVIWNTEYEHQKAKGKSDSESVKHADGVTNRVLGRYAVSNRSLGQKGELNRLMGIATQHLTAFKRQLNVEVNRDSPLGRRIIMSSLIFAGVMASVGIAMFIQDKATPDDPREDEDQKALKMKVQMAAELVSYMLGPYGRVLAGGINLYQGSDISISPVEHTIKKAIRGVSKIPVGMMTDYEYDARDWADVLGMMTMLTGVPFSSVTNLNDFALVFEDHEEVAGEREWKNQERAAYNEEVKFKLDEFFNN